MKVPENRTSYIQKTINGTHKKLILWPSLDSRDYATLGEFFDMADGIANMLSEGETVYFEAKIEKPWGELLIY